MSGIKMNVWRWGEVMNTTEETCNNMYYYAQAHNIECMAMSQAQFILLKNEYLIKTYGNAGVFSTKQKEVRRCFS